MLSSRPGPSFPSNHVCWLALVATGLFLGSIATAADLTEASGRELFLREWIPDDARSHAGDGLGPQFNESSCVGCHNQAGPGGAGPSAKNVQLVSIFQTARAFVRFTRGSANSSRDFARAFKEFKKSIGTGAMAGVPNPFLEDLFAESGDEAAGEIAKPARRRTAMTAAEIREQRDRAARIHPGFLRANSVVLHQFSTAPGYDEFRSKFQVGFFGGPGMMAGLAGMMPGGMPGIPGSIGPADGPHELMRTKFAALMKAPFSQIGEFTLIFSQRNTPSLFGTSQIDAIPDAVLLTAADKKHARYPSVSGRVARLKDGRLGRFGWKAQEATLRDFVLRACAVELGLHVPGDAQADVPQSPGYEPPGFDLNEEQCDRMVEFVASLKAPQVRAISDTAELKFVKRGRKLFDSVGCGVCHTPQLGDVADIYSDLLLHDMGQELSDSGAYGGIAPNNTEEEETSGPIPVLVSFEPKPKAVDESKLVGATRREWRTPPLWGVRDSAPYLHDGRAATLEQAIAFHGGEAATSARDFFELSEAERRQITMFLRTLIAPPE